MKIELNIWGSFNLSKPLGYILEHGLRAAKKYTPGEPFIEGIDKALEEDNDGIYSVFLNNVGINSDFAKDLRLYDTISTDCLFPKNIIGEGLIKFLGRYGACLILTSRYFKSHNELWLNFELSNTDTYYESMGPMFGKAINDTV